MTMILSARVMVLRRCVMIEAVRFPAASTVLVR
jgi:hypothetical protein